MYQAVRLTIGMVGFVGLLILTFVVKPWTHAGDIVGVGIKLWGTAAMLPMLGFALWGFRRDEAGNFGGGNRRPPVNDNQQVDTGTGRPGF